MSDTTRLKSSGKTGRKMLRLSKEERALIQRVAEKLHRAGYDITPYHTSAQIDESRVMIAALQFVDEMLKTP